MSREKREILKLEKHFKRERRITNTMPAALIALTLQVFSCCVAPPPSKWSSFAAHLFSQSHCGVRCNCWWIAFAGDDWEPSSTRWQAMKNESQRLRDSAGSWGLCTDSCKWSGVGNIEHCGSGQEKMVLPLNITVSVLYINIISCIWSLCGIVLIKQDNNPSPEMLSQQADIVLQVWIFCSKN